MADPLSVTASVLAVATAAIVSVRSLGDTVKSFQNRDKTLRRLYEKLEDLAGILDSLVEVVDTDASILLLLGKPIARCKQVCVEFEQSMKKFDKRSKTGLLDWTKLEFMKGDINEFIETVEGYKSTITVGLGTINLRNSHVSRDVLQKYEDLIKETAYNLELHLQQIDEKLINFNGQDSNPSNPSINLQDEKAVTQQCLRICEDASAYIDSLASRESDLLNNNKSGIDPGVSTATDFEAQVLLRQAFSESQTSLLGVIKSLGERLQSVITSDAVGNEVERSRLEEDLRVSKQCLQVCQVAKEVSHQKIHTIGEAITEDDSDQVVVTTLADLFDVKKALSRGHSAQLVATLTPENFDHVVEKRYNSRFGVYTGEAAYAKNGSSSPEVTIPQNLVQVTTSELEEPVPLSGQDARRDRPNPNEMRKRAGDSYRK